MLLAERLLQCLASPVGAHEAQVPAQDTPARVDGATMVALLEQARKDREKRSQNRAEVRSASRIQVSAPRPDPE